MRQTPRLLIPCIALLLLLAAPRAAANVVPQFEPNVVDETGTLTPDDREAINAALAEIRAKADIWGAALIVQRLDGDTIDSLGEKAFKEWKLGRAGVDNGLLLLLAIDDRESRFEVGYGLEGDLPDLIARRALDDVLAPRMRQGNVRDAIIQSFSYMAGVRSKDPAFQAAVDEAAASGDPEIDTTRGGVALGLFLCCLWIMPALTRRRARVLATRLEGHVPDFKVATDSALTGKPARASRFLQLFLSVNPGVFIFIGAGLNVVAALVIGAVILLIMWAYARGSLKRYRSPAVFMAFIEAQRRLNADMVSKGYMTETSPGRFQHTKAYYSSPEYKASRSSSSRSSSSSSGGGRSGGGGASSRW